MGDAEFVVLGLGDRSGDVCGDDDIVGGGGAGGVLGAGVEGDAGGSDGGVALRMSAWMRRA